MSICILGDYIFTTHFVKPFFNNNIFSGTISVNLFVIQDTLVNHQDDAG